MPQTPSQPLKLPRGRPPAPGHPKYKEYMELKSLIASGGIGGSQTADVTVQQTDEEMLQEMSTRFDIMAKIIRGAAEGVYRAAIISGAGGVGKTHTIRKILEHFKDKGKIQTEKVSGYMTAVNLFKLLWRNRTKTSIIILDDADGILDDPTGLQLLKAALDTSPVREISWMSESRALKEDDVPQTFIFEGSMIFITNRNMQGEVDMGRSKNTAHLEALMTRTHYVDLKLHTPRQKVLWIEHMVRSQHILAAAGLNKEQIEVVLNYIKEHRDKLRTLSLRTAMQIGEYILSEGNKWKAMADVLLMR
jgi:hypothetical protein